MSVGWTTSQKQRLRELNAPALVEEKIFCDAKTREKAFHEEERSLVEKHKKRLQNLCSTPHRPALCELEVRLADTLIKAGLVQVITPITLAKGLLEKMSITRGHSLWKQVFWVEEKRCLRPMLAPNLYYLLQGLTRLWEKPIRIFEIGPCFRKDSGGKYHLNEFTMLNLVELGVTEYTRHGRLKELITMVMETAGIKKYKLISTQCEVYQETVDVVADIEVGSGVIGPHSLDENWGIFDAWVGVGFGLERLVMVKEGYRNIQRAGRTLAYVDGMRLNV